MSDEVIVCRCEEVTLAELRRVLDSGVTTAHGLKLFSRAGMGMCQGRTCRAVVDAMAAVHGQRAESRPAAYRTPVRPTLLSEMAGTGEEAEQSCE